MDGLLGPAVQTLLLRKPKHESELGFHLGPASPGGRTKGAVVVRFTRSREGRSAAATLLEGDLIVSIDGVAVPDAAAAAAVLSGAIGTVVLGILPVKMGQERDEAFSVKKKEGRARPRWFSRA